jgi:thiamine-phosphate pyrophosphorylase
VTDRRSLSAAAPNDLHEALLLKIEAAAALGVDWIQIREKDLSARNCGSLTREALRIAASSSESKTAATRILVNDRLDIALTEHAGGVHLGEKSLPPAEAKRLANSRFQGSDFLAGVSCHSLEAAKSAAKDGADYLFFGPVFATPSKAAFGSPQGIEQLTEVCRAVSRPVLAIGGITLANASACLAAGAAGIAAIRLFQDAPDLSSVVRSLQGLID